MLVIPDRSPIKGRSRQPMIAARIIATKRAAVAIIRFGLYRGDKTSKMLIAPLESQLDKMKARIALEKTTLSARRLNRDLNN